MLTNFERIKTENDEMYEMTGNIGHEMIVPSITPYISSCEPSSHPESRFYQRMHADLASLSNKDKRARWITYRKEMNAAKNVDEEEQMDYDYDSEDMASCNLLRTKAIFALSNLALQKEDIVPALLMPISFNKAEQVEVRLAALSLLFISDPPAAFWNRVAVSTWWEPNDQVSHYIYTSIASLSNEKSPLRRQMAMKAQAVLPLMKPMFWTSYIAQHYFKSAYEAKSRLGYATETVTFPGFESWVPSNHYQSLSTTVGPWLVKMLEYSVSSKHAEKFLDRLIGKPGLRGKFERDAQITSPDMNRIHEELKISARATGQPEMYIYVNLLDSYQRFFTINPSTVSRVFREQMTGFRGNSARMDVNYHKYWSLADTFSRIPSSMGLAYTKINHHSVMLSLKSSVNGGVNMANMNAKVQGEIKPAVVFKMSTRLMVDTPWAEAYPTTGVDFQMAAALPATFSVDGDYQTGKIQTDFKIQGDKIRIAKYSVKPFTTIRKIRDFTPAILLDETKFISYLQEPKEVSFFLLFFLLFIIVDGCISQTDENQLRREHFRYEHDADRKRRRSGFQGAHGLLQGRVRFRSFLLPAHHPASRRVQSGPRQFTLRNGNHQDFHFTLYVILFSNSRFFFFF